MGCKTVPRPRNIYSSQERKIISVYLATLSPFARSVLRATIRIPMGQTLSYLQIARTIGNPGAARAVGSVLRKNTLAPLIPCHRVIRADGNFGNYSGKGGKRAKKTLLAREKAVNTRRG